MQPNSTTIIINFVQLDKLYTYFPCRGIPSSCLESEQKCLCSCFGVVLFKGLQRVAAGPGVCLSVALSFIMQPHAARAQRQKPVVFVNKQRSARYNTGRPDVRCHRQGFRLLSPFWLKQNRKLYMSRSLPHTTVVFINSERDCSGTVTSPFWARRFHQAETPTLSSGGVGSC